MKGMSSKLRAAVAAIGLLACASPLAAQTRHHRARALRYEAMWVERGPVGMRGPVRWYRDGARAPLVVVRRGAWAPRRMWLAPRLHAPRRFVVLAPRGRWIVRPRAGAAWRGPMRRPI